MQAVHSRIGPADLGRLQLRLRRVLRPAGGYYPPGQGEGRGDAGGDCAVQAVPAEGGDSWFAERKHLGTPLSAAELRHGVAVGLLSSSLLM